MNSPMPAATAAYSSRGHMVTSAVVQYDPQGNRQRRLDGRDGAEALPHQREQTVARIGAALGVEAAHQRQRDHQIGITAEIQKNLNRKRIHADQQFYALITVRIGE